MAKIAVWSVAGVVALGLVVGGAGVSAGDDEEGANVKGEKVTIDQVPAAVKAAILKEAAGSGIAGIEKKVKDGKAVYEAEWKVAGREVEVKVAADGALISREEEITMAELPEAVRKAVEKELAGAKPKEIERELKGGVVTYEIEYIAGGKEVEVKFAEDGTVLKRKTEEDK